MMSNLSTGGEARRTPADIRPGQGGKAEQTRGQFCLARKMRGREGVKEVREKCYFAALLALALSAVSAV